MTAQRDVVRIAALEVKVSALLARCEQLEAELVKLKQERVRPQGRAA